MLIVDCLTDNPNRTFGDVRICFTKTKNKIGAPGNCVHSFDHSAIFRFKHDDEEAVLEAMLMADVDVSDIENEEGSITIFAPQTEYGNAKQALLAAFGDDLDFDVDEIQFIPQTTIELSGDAVDNFETLIVMLEDLDDVQTVYHNVA